MIANPAGLWYLFFLVPLALVIWLRYRVGKGDLLGLAGSWREEGAVNLFVVKWFFSSLSILLFSVFAVLAIAGVSWGRYPVSTSYSGTDVAVAVDISRSMLAQDVFPSRIARTASVLRRLVETNTGVRIAIVVFKGSAVEVVPPTEDTEALTSITNVLGPSMLTSPGTNIQRGLDVAIRSFPSQDADRHIVLLFSDGGSLTGDPLVAARAAAAAHVPVYVVACGTTAGGPIPLGNGRFVEERGNRVITKVDLATLGEIARITNGELFRLTDPLLNEKIDSIIARHSSAGPAGSYRFEVKDQYRVFVASALVCLCVFLAARIIRWRGLL